MKSLLILVLLALGLVSRAAAADAKPLGAPPTEPVIIDHTQVETSFAKGLPAWLANTSYKIQAGRRLVGGKPELHEHDTDILWVTEGSATFVTGGKIIGQVTKSPGEIGGDKIEGGVTRKVVKGDLIVVPQGVPHWFSEVEGTFLYFVVKVTK
jgi:mannose-6-phosphate isomerase-like protein (cupin superfamily)